MKKVLLISDKLEHYRIPLFESLCDAIELTVAYSNIRNEKFKFKSHIIKVENKGPFITYSELPILEKYDVVIFPFNLRCIQLFKYLFRTNKFKLYVFGIGVSASYNRLYDADKKLDFLRRYVLKKCQGAIFYEKYPFIKYTSVGIDPAKISIAYNTVSPNKNFDIVDKKFDSFIFVGSLYKQKKISDLLLSYKALFDQFKGEIPILEIVGDGDEFENIQQWVENNSLKNMVIMHGSLNKDNELMPIFQRAIACISPGQAGLSVQKCFSYGVPFITSFSAITGGEALSIINKETGLLYDSSISGLTSLLTSVVKGDVDIVNMSKKCYLFYHNFRSVEIWKEGFLHNIVNN